MEVDLFEQSELDYLRQNFTRHAVASFGRANELSSSPLYESLALCAAEDQEVLRLVLRANTRPQRPHLLFAAVQYLLLGDVQDVRDVRDELAEFYPNLTRKPRPREQAYPAFRAFCLGHAGEIGRLVTTYGVQNNEVGRCADLLLAFDRAARLGGGRPLAMIELGASAGLTLLWDRYGYDYGALGHVGDRTSPVQLRCQLRGDVLPPLPAAIPRVSWRTGIDLNPLDVHDEGAVRWLRALIWPEEHRDRAPRLDAALEMARRHPVTIVAGDAVDRLPDVLERAPAEATLCIYHSYAMNQTPEPVRARIFAQIAAAGRTREVFHVAEEWYASMDQPELELSWHRPAGTLHERLAECESHGRWLRFLA
jgi:hypothetical protein